MSSTKRVWFMEAFSSQREIILSVKAMAAEYQLDLEVFASHRQMRHEILSVADYALIEPNQADERLAFVIDVIQQYHIDVLYTVKHAAWFEAHRTAIEATGVLLVTGTADSETLTLSNHKMDFVTFMQAQNLPATPSILINNLEELAQHLDKPPFTTLCIKPVEGIYGMGFWRLDERVQPARILSHPEERKIPKATYLALSQASEQFEPMVLMPYLKSPEHSVDIVAHQGSVLAAVARRKEGSQQVLLNSGPAFDLACQCAQMMKADGLVNVQTRNDDEGNPMLLEINMRPSGGVGNTLYSGVNLVGVMVLFHLNVMSADDVRNYCTQEFKPNVICSVSSVIEYPQALSHLVRSDKQHD